MNKNLNKVLLMFFVIFCLVGCAGLKQIAIEGSLVDKSGKIVFSLDETQTQDNKTPVFVDSDKEKHYLVDSQTIDKIVDKIREFRGEVAGLAVSKNGRYKQLIEIISEKRKEEQEE